jgi:hypothetical protein
MEKDIKLDFIGLRYRNTVAVLLLMFFSYLGPHVSTNAVTKSNAVLLVCNPPA